VVKNILGQAEGAALFIWLLIIVKKRIITELWKAGSKSGSFGVEGRFWRNNGFVFGFESGSFLLDNGSR
jgi:hypothetical protein